HDRPYTGMTPPRATRLSGEARKAMVAATSSTFGHAAWSAFGMAARFAAVSMIDGATALTRMPSLATSSASAAVSAATAALHAVIEPRHRRLVGKIAARHQAHLRVLAQRKALRLGLVQIGHVTVRAALDERAHQRGPERPGPAGHDDMTVAVVHGIASVHHRD